MKRARQSVSVSRRVRRGPAFRRPSPKGSVLVIVMITVLFTTFALVAFIEKAGNDLIVEQHYAEARRLRSEAYSALEVTLAVLEDFRQVGNGLHSPSEGWSDPLTFANYTPNEGRTVDIAFEDESGKLSLPRVDAVTLSRLFQSWDILQADADSLADALIGWMQPNHVYTTAIAPTYDQGDLPYLSPDRPMRSYSELAAIEKARDVFYDTDGRPNALWYRFVDSVSLFNFTRPNINGAKTGALAALAQFETTQQQNIADYFGGTGAYQSQGPGLPFQNVAEAEQVAGPGGSLAGFGTAISALRIIVTVHDGSSQFRLAAVVAPPGGATTTQTTATSTRAQTSANTSRQQNQTNSSQQNPGAATRNNPTAQRALNYPFTLLEIRENNDIPPTPPPPPPTED